MVEKLDPVEARVRALRYADAFSEVVFRDVTGLPRGRSFGDRAGGIAHAVANPSGGWTLEVAGSDAAELASSSARILTDTTQDPIVWWVHDDADPGPDFALERTLRKMARTLPVDESPRFSDDITTRAFVAGVDELDWLGVNNRAFSGHAEQGAWTRTDLEHRMRYEWFDPDDLRLVFSGQRLVGFNWTKVEETESGREGQIFVIGIDPDFSGRGLGRATIVEGLRHLHEVRGATSTSLFVDEANAAGVHLYESLGYETTELHRAYRYVGDRPNDS